MLQPRVMMLSLWRNDQDRRLRERAEHLLAKTYDNLRWVWVVGDCAPEDRTFGKLWQIATVFHPTMPITFVPVETSLTLNRFERMSVSASAGLEEVGRSDDFVVIHESDILSPYDVVERFVAHAKAGRCPIAGWPTLTFPSGYTQFYDIWGYRKAGRLFHNDPPYHACYHPTEPFEVDSVGTVWMLPAEDVRRGVRCYQGGAVELCQKLRANGRRIWVDPTLVVEQPYDLTPPDGVAR